jgi:hypothetical protein
MNRTSPLEISPNPSFPKRGISPFCPHSPLPSSRPHLTADAPQEEEIYRIGQGAVTPIATLLERPSDGYFAFTIFSISALGNWLLN